MYVKFIPGSGNKWTGFFFFFAFLFFILQWYAYGQHAISFYWMKEIYKVNKENVNLSRHIYSGYFFDLIIWFSMARCFDYSLYIEVISKHVGSRPSSNASSTAS